MTRRRNQKRMLTFVLLSCLIPLLAHAQLSKETIDHAIAFSARQLKRSIASFGDSLLYPRSTVENGSWKTVKPGDWTSGFFPGCLWYGYELTGDDSLKLAAVKWTAGMESQKFNRRTHDIGFMMYCSFGNAYCVSPNEHEKDVLLQSARTLALRFNNTVGCIRSWDFGQWQFPVIIDNMMNLELLFWAAKNGGGDDLYEIAKRHAATTMKNHFRPDGSTYHVVSYDTTTGEVISRSTHQGYADESVWARGQAWAIYGFAMAYRETGDEDFLKTAERAADWFLSHLPEDNVPFWDFKAPGIPNEPRDASAAAVAASALLELQGVAETAAQREKYSAAAEALLQSLCSSPYLAEGSASMGIINHTTGNMPAKSEIDVSLSYGDYYFLEALTRYRNNKK